MKNPVRQRGFTLIELTVTIGVVTLLTIFALRFTVNEAYEQTAKVNAAYFNSLRSALNNYIHGYYEPLQRGQAIAGYVNPLSPTILELRADATLRLLPGSFPVITPFSSPVAINITRGVNCVANGGSGLGCTLDVVVNTARPLTDNDGFPQYNLVDTVRANTEGGLAADAARPDRLSGLSGDFPNPLGNQGGVVGFATSLNGTTMSQYVRRNEDRATNLNENLTVSAGPLAVGGVALTTNGNVQVNGNLTTTGNLTTGNLTTSGINLANGCVSIANNGVITINCQGTLAASKGIFTDAAGNRIDLFNSGPGNLVISDAFGRSVRLNSGGRVSASDGFETPSVRMFTDSQPESIVSQSGQLLVSSPTQNLLDVNSSGAFSSGMLQGTRLSATDTAVPGQACANSGSGSDLVTANPNSGYVGLLACSGGTWKPMSNQRAAQGSSCAAEGLGAGAIEQSTGAAMTCRALRGSLVWSTIDSQMSNYVMVDTVMIENGTGVVNAPIQCPMGGTGATPIIILVPGSYQSSDGIYNHIATPNGSGWNVSLTNGAGAIRTTSTAVATLYCLFPP